MTTSVWRAFLASGALNAGTPFEMASTPVMAAPPEAKACSTIRMVAAPVASSGGRVGRGHVRRARRRPWPCRSPSAIITNMLMMNR